MDIFIAGKNGQTIPLRVDLTETILNAKKRVKQEKATWKLEVDVLIDHKKFGDYEIENGDTITSSFKVFGGIN